MGKNKSENFEIANQIQSTQHWTGWSWRAFENAGKRVKLVKLLKLVKAKNEVKKLKKGNA